MSVQLSAPDEIQAAYGGSATAAAYVEQRFTSELMRLLHDRQVAAVQRVFDHARPTAALEVAPGPGRITRSVRPSGRLTCLEFNAGMIAEGQAACRNGAVFLQGDAFQLPFKEEFQLLYSFRFVRHFHSAERQKLYAQFRRVLQPSGVLILDAVNKQVSLPLREASPSDYPIYDKLYADEDELTRELAVNGFEVERLTPVQRWFSLQSRVQWLVGPRSRLMARGMIRALERARRGPALEWIVQCRRA